MKRQRGREKWREKERGGNICHTNTDHGRARRVNAAFRCLQVMGEMVTMGNFLHVKDKPPKNSHKQIKKCCRKKKVSALTWVFKGNLVLCPLRGSLGLGKETRKRGRGVRGTIEADVGEARGSLSLHHYQSSAIDADLWNTCKWSETASRGYIVLT